MRRKPGFICPHQAQLGTPAIACVTFLDFHNEAAARETTGYDNHGQEHFLRIRDEAKNEPLGSEDDILAASFNFDKVQERNLEESLFLDICVRIPVTEEMRKPLL